MVSSWDVHTWINGVHAHTQGANTPAYTQSMVNRHLEVKHSKVLSTQKQPITYSLETWCFIVTKERQEINRPQISLKLSTL